MSSSETVLHEGPASHKTRFGAYVVCILVPVVGWIWALGIRWKIRSTIFKVTNQRIEITRGILSKNVDSVLLWRVRDVRWQQTLGERILGIADIVLTFDDAEDLVLRGLPEARALYDKLVTAVDEASRSRRAVAAG